MSAQCLGITSSAWRLDRGAISFSGPKTVLTLAWAVNLAMTIGVHADNISFSRLVLNILSTICSSVIAVNLFGLFGWPMIVMFEWVEL